MQKEKIAGILSNWDQILADARTNIHDDFGESKDVQDIIDLIHHLQVLANSDNPLRTMLETHVADHGNPHEFTLDINDIALFDTLYAEFTSQYGNLMTLAEFITSIIHVKRFATRQDVDLLTNLEDAANLDVLAYSISEHDVSVDAHADLLRFHFPGEPIQTPPTITIIPNILSTINLSIERGSSINVYDSDGRVRSIPDNTIAVDYMYGIPTLPVFDTNRNSILNSVKPTLVESGASSVPVSNIPTLYTPLDDQDYHLILEDGVAGIHGFSLLGHDVLQSGMHTFIFHYFPIMNKKVRVRVLADGVVVGYCNFDFQTITALGNLDNLLGGKVSTSIVRLPNGWHRCSMSVDLPSMFTYDLCFLDDAGNEEYAGSGGTAGAFWQFQLSDGPYQVPVIISGATEGALAPTKITRQAVGDAYNRYSGAISIKALTPLSEIFGVPYSMMAMYKDSDMIVSIGSNSMDSSKLDITTMNILGATLTSIYSDAYDPTDPQLIKQAVLGYTYGHQSYGFTNNVPHMFDYYGNTENGPDVVTIDESGSMQNDYFSTMAGTPPFSYTAPVLLQLPTSTNDPIDSPLPLTSQPEDLLPKYIFADACTDIVLGYNRDSDVYLNGYIVEFLYYPVFAESMNVEFLCNEYVKP